MFIDLVQCLSVTLFGKTKPCKIIIIILNLISITEFMHKMHENAVHIFLSTYFFSSMGCFQRFLQCLPQNRNALALVVFSFMKMNFHMTFLQSASATLDLASVTSKANLKAVKREVMMK